MPLIERAAFLAEEINFRLTNKIPRRLFTRFMGWFSRLEYPFIARPSLAIWRFCAPGLRLHEARKTRFTSIHDCFTRELKDGMRPVDPTPDSIVSPCDAIVGACGRIAGTQLFQAKGFPYTLEDLLCDRELAASLRDGRYASLRLTPSMYHRFHAPCDGDIEEVIYVPGDTWNVNPAALHRVERLYCRNERAVIRLKVKDSPQQIVLVPVAAILVASIQLTRVNLGFDSSYAGPRRMRCPAPVHKGDELGYFSHGSTILVFATAGIELCDTVRQGQVIRMGEPLLRHSSHAMAGAPTTAS